MKKIFKRINLIDIYIIINILYLFIGSYFTVDKYDNIKIFANGLIVLLILNIIVILILFFRKKNKYKTIDIILLLIIIFGIISTIFAYNQEVALFGTRYRYEGLFTICYYMSLLFLSSFSKNKKLIVYSILLGGLVIFAYAWCQKNNLYDIKTITHLGERWAKGFSTNPNFFATMMLLCLSFSIGLFIDENKIIIGLLIIIFMSGILISNTLSCFVGMIVVILFSLFYTIKTKKYLSILIVVILIISTTALLTHFKQTTMLDDYLKYRHEVNEMAHGKIHDEYGNDRLFIWMKSLEFSPKYMIHGIGLDNYLYIDNGRPIIRWGIIVYDKAHCEYLQYLVTGGVFYLLSYLALFFISLKDGIKQCFKKKETYLILPVIGYLTQAAFNISVIEVAPFFYITLGLLVNRNKKDKLIWK